MPIRGGGFLQQVFFARSDDKRLSNLEPSQARFQNYLDSGRRAMELVAEITATK